MDASLTECLKSLSEIRHQLQTLQLESALLKNGESDDPVLIQLRKHLELNKSVKRQFDYRGMIVSIYGILEQFIDGVIAEYVRATNMLSPTYGEVAEAIRKNHLELSLELIGQVQSRHYRGDNSVGDIISHLHSCLSGSDEYVLNATAFASRRANYRTEVIATVFSRIGIPGILDRIRRIPSVRATLERLHPDRKLNELDNKTAFQLFDDLAERRNDVAHGNTSDTLSPELLHPYVDLVESVASGVQNVALNALLPAYAQYYGTTPTAAIKVYNNEIVCLSVVGVVVQRGDLLVGQTSDGEHYVGGAIQRIEVNHEQVDSVDATEVTKVGFKVSFRAKENLVYSIVSKDHVV